MATKDPTPQGGGNPPAPDRGAGERLIGGHFSVDVARPILGGGGGLAAFGTERRGPGPRGMAIQARPDAPPRMQAIAAVNGLVIPDLMIPLAAGPSRGPDGREAVFVVCIEPPGPPLAAAKLRPWSEAELLTALLRPAAAALEALQAAGVAHRAIRLDNLFHASGGGGAGGGGGGGGGGAGNATGVENVMLGCAWASPPALLQPALYEPPYVAMCQPAARGEGAVADDVYALAVVMIALALGRVPLAGLDEGEVVRRKLELGSYKALVGNERLPPIITDLVSGMLAEDPEHRPPPKLLADPLIARARRVAARPPRRGQRPLEIGGHEVWNARSLAHALAHEPDGGARLLRANVIAGWLRRSLGEAPLATKIEEAVRQRQAEAAGEDARADAMLGLRAVVSLDPLAPLAWDGLVLWPDSIGALLASLPAEAVERVGGGAAAGADSASQPDVAVRLAQVIANEAALIWAALRPERCDLVTLRLDMRQHRAKLRLAGWGGGMPRLRFTLNPLLGCRSRLLGDATVLRLSDLLPAIEAAARPEHYAALPIDREIAAFIAARDEQSAESILGALGNPASADAPALPPLRLYASLQQRYGVRPLPRLGAWFAHHLAPAAQAWRNRARRERNAETLRTAAAEGQLAALLATVHDPEAHAEDAAGARAAELAVQRIDAELAALKAAWTTRTDAARRIGCELSTGIGLAAVAVMAIAAMAG